MILRNVSLLLLAVGLALLAYMIPVEGEPGALPLGLVLFGTIGFIVSRLRARRGSAPSQG
jgi:hypothetical protein